MEVRTKLFKRQSQSDRRKGKWVLRIEYFDQVAGKVQYKENQFDRRSDAVDARRGLESDIQKTHGQIQTGEKMTFADLAGTAASQFYKKAVIEEGRKVDGIRSFVPTHTFIKTLVQYFGKKRIGQIATADLRAYKAWRFKLGSRLGKSDTFTPISITTVNRELATMRRMMKHAFHEGWIVRDIFAAAKVIDTDAETVRDRRLTDAEETRLLTSCQGTPFLKSIVLIALDSAMRRGEILTLKWRDFDFDARLIRVQSSHTKTERSRIVPLSERCVVELKRLPSFGIGDVVFPFAEFKRSWKTAKKLAGISDLHFHDLRRTAVTRFSL
ncbi:MAG: site-specific integrase, partial [Pyrinomonadaceae bacterium]